ncbi:MAG: tetratricopeptide repeat protein [Acidobacteria bacterium]|nr:tetratricopeptide repeat protein [Acidobacteriota bacterium]
MKYHPSHCLGSFFLFVGLVLACDPTSAQKSSDQPPTKPINIDEELAEKVEPNRAASYYHFSLAKWIDDRGNFAKAISEMETALQYNPDSPAIHLEMAELLEKSGSYEEAIEHAKKAAQLAPQSPDPHWFLASIYFRPQLRGRTPTEGILKAVQELERLRELSPEDERVYYALGGAYFEIDEPEKAIQAFEKFQSLSAGIDNGYREIAKYYDRNGDYEKAAEYLAKGLKIQPDSIESLNMMGGVLAKLSKNREAIPIYKKLRELTGGHQAVSRQLASVLIEAGEFDEAHEILNELLKTNPGDPAYKILVGRAQMGMRKYPEAIETLQSVAASNPAVSVEAQFYLGRAYEDNSNYAEAVKVFSRLLEKTAAGSEEADANRHVFQQHLAANYMELHEFENAIAIYKDLAKEDPKTGYQLLHAYRVSRQFEKGITFGRIQYEKDPDNIPIAIGYARILADAGKPREGIEILTALLQSHPDEIDVYVALSQLYLQDKRYADAERLLLRAESTSFKNALDTERIRFMRAEVYEKQKDFDRAESVLKEILKENPNNAVALNYIGYMLADRGVRLEEALQYVKEALAIDPRNGAYLDSIGWAFFKLNDMQNAEKYLLEADQIVKNDPTIVEHLGDLYFKIGDLEKAQSYWMRSISIGTIEEDIQKVRRKLEMLQDKLRRQKPAK